MKRHSKALLSILLIVCLLGNTIVGVWAVKNNPKEEKTLHIKTVEQFMDFSRRCRMDSYSKNLTVYLESDIDLSNVSYESIPIFYGTFLGKNHTIKGINIKAQGSQQGLFRYIAAQASVKNLFAEGKIASAGRCESVGAIAGSNSGKIENCSFNGEIGAGDYVGGIAGINTVTGVIEKCSVEGEVHAKHFVGGIVGENKGVVRNCLNYANINTTVQQNIVGISDISLNGLKQTEAINTVTDIGGIAGSSSGVIKDSKNYANVGYIHMGYNIGGIVGSQVGYLTNCENFASISGRKEVGGIAGQMEPSAKIVYSTDSVQLLQKQLNDIYYRSHHISNTTDNNSTFLKNQLINLGDTAKDALVALGELIPEDEEGLNDPDRQQAALNVLSSSTNSMLQTMGSMHESTENSAISTSNDFKTIINQIDNMAATMCRPDDKLGGSFKDASDTDTKDDLTGKIEKSINYGTISGDLNAGGITGSIAWENDFDPEDDWHITGETSLNFESELRAVILGCENYAEVTGKKRNIGGIVGYMAFGLVKDCISTGRINAQGTQFAGGIAGDSEGYLRNNSAKCEITAKSYAGGIAGRGATVTDCRSMTFINSAKEKYGAVLGVRSNSQLNKDTQIKRNYYMIAKKDFGGIDGISYAGVAQPVGPKGFFDIPKLDEMFKTSKITFVSDYGIVDIVYVSTGEALSEEDIPNVPEELGKVGEWDRLNLEDLKNIYFDLTFHTTYTQNVTTVQSKMLRLNGKPILMAQSSFSNMKNFEIEKLEVLPTLDNGLTAIEGWKIPKFTDEKTQLRYALPKGYDADSIRIFIRNSDGKWKETKFEVNNSYVVFSINSYNDAICMAAERNIKDLIYIICAIILFLILEVVLIIVIVKKKLYKKIKKRKA